ncbi:MAG: hypothetical protein HKO62_07105 [Gammaproteobacteria bacterium]|nr:hypothetical protein [Gammaproteobacteria bacterium]
MLQVIRERAKGLVAMVIIGFICLTFALWGIQEYLNAGQNPAVAEINGEEVTQVEFQREYYDIRQQAQSLLGASFNPADWETTAARQQVLNAVIEKRVLRQLTERARVRVGDEQLARGIQEIPQFSDPETGRFSNELYQQFLRNQALSPGMFERRMREDMTLQQLRQGIAASEFVPTADATRVEVLASQERDVGYAVIPGDKHAADIEITDADIEAYYQGSPADYEAPESVRLAYLELSVEKLAEEVELDDGAVESYFRTNIASYSREEQRSANHILVQVAEDADAATADAAREKVLLLKSMAQGGASFADVAMENSDDIGSRADGGATGFFGRGVMEPAFEEAVFALEEPGEISEPVRTRFGWHVIKLDEIRPGGEPTLAEARGEVEEDLRRERAEAMYYDLAEQLTNLAYEFPDTLDVAAQETGLSVQATDFLTREQIASRFGSRVAAVVFLDEVVNEGLNSEPIEVDGSSIISVRVEEYKPKALRPLDDVRNDIAATLKLEATRTATREIGEAMLARLRAGEPAAEVVAEQGLKWSVAPRVSRESDELPRAVTREAFRIGNPGDGSAAYAGVPMGSGDFAVIEVSAVYLPDAGEVEKGEVAQARARIETDRSQAAWRRFVDGLRERADVKAFSDNI